eukprot:g41811.t1
MEKNTRQRIYFQDGENRIINNNTDYTGRINVDKSYTLTIDNVELRDERTFCCQVGAGPAGNGEATTELKVYGKRAIYLPYHSIYFRGHFQGTMDVNPKIPLYVNP